VSAARQLEPASDSTVNKENPNMTALTRLSHRLASTAAAILATVALGLLLVVPTSARADFGVTGFSGLVSDEGGDSFSQAAAHPHAASTTISFPLKGILAPDGQVKDVFVELPPGFIGNPEALAALCTQSQLSNSVNGFSNGCPIDSQVGTAVIQLNGTGTAHVNVYAMPAPDGSPARFGFKVANVPVYLTASVRSGSDYGITVAGKDISTFFGVESAAFTFWGVPADPSHDGERGLRKQVGLDECAELAFRAEPCDNPATTPPVAFLTNPGDCGAGPLATLARVDEWAHPGFFHEASFSTDTNGNPTAVSGCNQVPFEPQIDVAATTNQADSPSGLGVEISIPTAGLVDPDGTAQANLKKAVVTLPRGMTVNPASANGLGACSPAQVGLATPIGQTPIRFTPDPANCPDSSKLGTVEVDTPLLDHPILGSVYLAAQDDNPFGSLLALYITAEDPTTGVVLKLPGLVVPDPQSGQLTATFDENPQLPFAHLRADFFKGAQASLRTPVACGSFTTTTEMTPWSTPETANATPSSSFDVTQGAGGGACVSDEAAAPNSPAFTAGTVDPTAGAFTPFVLRLARQDGTQQIKSVETILPKGLLGKLAGVPYCPDAALAAASGRSGRAEQGSSSCPAASEVGTVSVTAGAGPAPLSVGGKAYLAGPYKGAPLSLAIVTPAVAGPFDLGTVVVRVALDVDPATAQIRAVSDPIPAILQGIPLDLRTISLSVARPQFTLNPTSCNPMAITGSALSVFGQAAALSNPFQVGDCGRLAFKPGLALRLKGGTKRDDNPALTATLTYPAGANANIAGASVALPHSAFLDQSHIRTVCTRVQYAADACPPGSVYGFARAFSPLLEKPLEGPVYLRSSSNPLPDLVAALKGQIDIDLAGRIDSVRGGIRTTFEGVPDAPVSKFVLAMKGGKKGLLVNSRDICKHVYRATAQFTAQSGKAFDSRPVLKNSSCKKAKGKRGKAKKG
jgi:hypothetical protein